MAGLNTAGILLQIECAIKNPHTSANQLHRQIYQLPIKKILRTEYYFSAE